MVNMKLKLLLLLLIEEHRQHTESVMTLMLNQMQNVMINDPVFWMNINHHRIDGFNEEWINLYLGYDFFALFRMSKETFEVLWEKIDGSEYHQEYQGGRVPIKGRIQLLMTLWWLGKGEALLSVSEKFNVAVSTVYNATSIVWEKLLKLLAVYITWPSTAHEIEIVEEGLGNRCGFPGLYLSCIGVIGAVDGTNIKFKAPIENQDSYIDKNDNHSLKLQVICTHNKLFTNIGVGFPGSVHDARMFRNSKIYIDVTENRNQIKYFPMQESSDRNDRHLTRRQRAFDYALSQTRVVVEHSIGLLKGRCRILKYINVNSEERAIKIIAACCMLHNFCYLNGDAWEFEEYEQEVQNNGENRGVENHIGLLKRDRISDLFH